jgi:predicted transcriptional regulator
VTGPDTLQIAQRKCTIDLEELDHRFSTFPVDLFRTLSVVDPNLHVDYYSYRYPHHGDWPVKTVQMTLDDELVEAVDRVVKRIHTSRSAFTRNALREALTRYSIEQLENKHKEGYERHPVAAGEFSDWEGEQAWSEQ